MLLFCRHVRKRRKKASLSAIYRQRSDPWAPKTQTSLTMAGVEVFVFIVSFIPGSWLLDFGLLSPRKGTDRQHLWRETSREPRSRNLVNLLLQLVRTSRFLIFPDFPSDRSDFSDFAREHQSQKSSLAERLTRRCGPVTHNHCSHLPCLETEFLARARYGSQVAPALVILLINIGWELLSLRVMTLGNKAH